MKRLNLFQGDEHKSFNWSGGRPAALLVHGFPGTPAELRPLGQSLHRAGWTVQGLLLPGFGAEFETLFDRHYTEWLKAVKDALARLQSNHQPVVLVGYSMGAALALNVAAAQPPTALILLAPFWQVASRWQQWVGFLLKPFLRQVRPFQKADFSDPQVRRGVGGFFPNLDLDDPENQAVLRELTVPTRVFEQLHRLGQSAYRLAPELSLPILVIQGTQDQVARPDHTHNLLQQLTGPLHYIQLVAGHDLIRPELPAWPHLERAISTFTQALPDLSGGV